MGQSALLSPTEPLFKVDAALVKSPEGLLERCLIQHGRRIQDEPRRRQARCVTPKNFVASVALRVRVKPVRATSSTGRRMPPRRFPNELRSAAESAWMVACLH